LLLCLLSFVRVRVRARYAALRLPLTFVATLSLLSSAVVTRNPELMDRLPKYKLSFPPSSTGR